MNVKFLIYTLSLILLSACNDSSNKELTDLIESNQEKWKNTSISSYTFIYLSLPTDCPIVDPFPPIEITVENRVITSVYVPELGSYLDIDSQVYPTIDKVFENMLNSVEDIQETPLFEQTFGYPIRYVTDASDLECDGYLITIDSFI